MSNYKKLKTQFGQTDTIEGMITGLTRKLETLAPHPDQKFHLAPLFTSISEGNVITAFFNRKTLYHLALDAYNADLPARLSLTRRINALRRILAAGAHTVPAAPEQPAFA
ncbi:MAG: hypothetical protein ACT4OY_07680 [Alphaproteobacteria bacterium]